MSPNNVPAARPSKGAVLAAGVACAAVFLLAGAFPTQAADTVGPSPWGEPGQYITYIPPAPGYPGTQSQVLEHTGTYPGWPASYTTGPQTLSVTPLALDYRKGDWKTAVLLVDFSDTNHRIANTKSLYDQKVNGNASSDTSLRTYFYASSYGNYTITGVISDWVKLPQTKAWYAQHTANLVGDAAKAADASVDFSTIDANNDGWVDNVVIVHAGNDQAASGDPTDIWSHSSAGYAVTVDGKRVSGYATVAEFPGAGAYAGDPIGVMMHEFGHEGLGLPDLYDTAYNNAGLGDWDIMAGGAWQGGGDHPAHHSAWSKYYLGWTTPFEPAGNVDPYTIYATSDFNRANPVRITTNYTNEYFLIEFRSTAADNRYDTYLPYSGLVIYHVDDTVIVNTWERGYNSVESTTSHKGIDIEEVGTQDMDTSPWHTGGGWASNDVWVSNAAGFTPTSNPNSNLYANSGTYATGIKVYNISALLNGGVPHMTFSIDTGRVNFGLSGRVLGSPNQQALPGSSASYSVQFTTFASTGDNVALTLEGDSAALASLDRSTLTLPPFGSATATLTVPIPLGWTAGDPAAVQVRGTSTAQASNNVLVSTVTYAAQVFAIDTVGDVSYTATPGVESVKSFTVRNLGNGPDNVSVSPTYDPAKITVSILAQPAIMGRGASTAVPVDFNVSTSVPDGTVIPVSFELRYGAASSFAYLTIFANITAGKFAVLSLSAAPLGLAWLTPGEPRVFNLTIVSQSNYAATVNLTATAPTGVSVVFDVQQLVIPAFGSHTVGATVTAGHDTAAGTAGPVLYTATSVDGLGTPAIAQTDVQVSQRFELALTGDSAFSASPGGTAIFNLVAVNLGNGPDATNLSYGPTFADWGALLSKDTIALNTTLSGRSVNFEFRVTVPANARGNLLQTFAITLRSELGGATVTMPVTILVLPVYAFAVTADAAQGAITSKESATFLINFQNYGNVRDSYSVTLANLPEGWTQEFASGGVATVQAGGVGQVTLIVHPLETAAADRFEFQMFASSEGNLSRPTVLPLNVTIVAHREIQMTATPVDGDVRPGATVRVALLVKNLGNVNENLYLDPQQGAFASVQADPLQLMIPAYQQRVVTVVVVLKDNQAPGPTTLVVNAAAVNNASVASESAIPIQVAALPPAPTTPGFASEGALLALAGAAVFAAATSRKRK